MTETVDHCFGPGLLWSDANEEPPRFDRDRQGPDGVFESFRVFENVLYRKVVRNNVVRTSECSLPNIPLTQEPYTEFHFHGPRLSLLERLEIWIDGRDPRIDRLPFVPITTPAAPTVQYM